MLTSSLATGPSPHVQDPDLEAGVPGGVEVTAEVAADPGADMTGTGTGTGVITAEIMEDQASKQDHNCFLLNLSPSLVIGSSVFPKVFAECSKLMFMH